MTTQEYVIIDQHLLGAIKELSDLIVYVNGPAYNNSNYQEIQRNVTYLINNINSFRVELLERIK